MIDPSTIKVGDLIEYKFNFMEDVQRCQSGRVTGIRVHKFLGGNQISIFLDNEDMQIGADEVIKVLGSH